MKLQIIDSKSQQPMERDLLQMVHHLAKAAGLKKMPEVALYQSEEVNAFATGPSKSNSLVAVSTGLLNKLSEDEKFEIEEKKSLIDDIDLLYVASMNKVLVSNIFSILKIRNMNKIIL